MTILSNETFSIPDDPETKAHKEYFAAIELEKQNRGDDPVLDPNPIRI